MRYKLNRFFWIHKTSYARVLPPQYTGRCHRLKVTPYILHSAQIPVKTGVELQNVQRHTGEPHFYWTFFSENSNKACNMVNRLGKNQWEWLYNTKQALSSITLCGLVAILIVSSLIAAGWHSILYPRYTTSFIRSAHLLLFSLGPCLSKRWNTASRTVRCSLSMVWVRYHQDTLSHVECLWIFPQQFPGEQLDLRILHKIQVYRNTNPGWYSQ